MFLKNVWVVVFIVLFVGCNQANREESINGGSYKVPSDNVADDVGQKLGASSGEEIFKSCAGCHGENGEKRALGVSAVIGYWEVVSIVQALEGYKNSTRNQYGMGGLMKGQVAGLSSDDIRNVANYIYSLQPK